LTTPTPGSTVTGSIAIAATASDNVAVASVQFYVDGLPFAAAVTAAPYTRTWDTTTVPNGPHTVTAVATDAAGNTAQVIVSLSVLNAVAPPPPVSSGLVAAYNFDEGAGALLFDTSGNGNVGSIVDATWAAGRSGTALSFTSKSLVTVADSASLDLTAGMTLEAWVRPATTNNAVRPVIVKEWTNSFGYGLFSSGGSTSAGRPMGMVRTTMDRRAIGSSPVPTNTWTHLAVTYDGSVVRLYVNGVQVGSIAASGPITAGTGALQLGGLSQSSDVFRGLMDDVRIYNRALTASEIAADRNTPVK
jgi:hypothetical protein